MTNTNTINPVQEIFDNETEDLCNEFAKTINSIKEPDGYVIISALFKLLIIVLEKIPDKKIQNKTYDNIREALVKSRIEHA